MAASLQTERKKEKVQDTALAPAVGLFVLFLWGWGWGSWGVCVCVCVWGGVSQTQTDAWWCCSLNGDKYLQSVSLQFSTHWHKAPQLVPFHYLVVLMFEFLMGMERQMMKIQWTELLYHLPFWSKGHTHTHTSPPQKNSGNPSVFKDGVSCTDSNVAVNWTWRVHKSRCMNWWSCVMGDPATAGHGKQGHSTVHYMAHCFCWEWCKYIHTVCILTGIQAETSVYPSF